MIAFIKQIPFKFIRLLIISRLHEIPFIVFTTFLITFAVTRTYIHLTQFHVLPSIISVDYVAINGIHIHHLTWGIIILSIVGFLALISKSPFVHRRLAVLYGIGLGLTFDEFAIWLNLDEDYYSGLTYDAIVAISTILLAIIYFPPFWRKMKRHFQKHLDEKHLPLKL